MYKNIGFIFARGGSRGLPKKNIYPFLGKPLIQHTIEFAKSMNCFDAIFVSSDNKEILKIAELNDLPIIKRPKYLSNSKSPEWKAWQHAIKYVNRHYGEFKTFVCLPTTSPLREKRDLLKGLKEFNKKNCDVCLSYTKSSKSPYFNMAFKNHYEYLKIIKKSLKLHHRQTSPVTFDLCTLFYILNPKFILRNNHLFEGKVKGIEIPKSRSIDIDDLQDLKIAEFLKTINNQ